MVITTVFDTGSNIAWVRKVRAGVLPLRHPVKNKIRSGNKNNNMVLTLAERNVRKLLDRDH